MVMKRSNPGLPPSFPLRTRNTAGLSLQELAGHVAGARLEGDDPELRIQGVAPPAVARASDLALLSDPRYLEGLQSSGAGALLVRAGLEKKLDDPRPRLVVPDPHAAMRRILERLHPEKPWPSGIHPGASVDPDVTMGAGISVGPGAVVEAGAVLGDRVRVGALAVVGAGVRVGDDVILHPQVTLYPGVVLGDRVVIHSGARIGVDGFGFVFEEGEHMRIPHVGGCVLEDDVEVGANVCIDRGSVGETRIGAGTKIDNLVHLGHNVRVGARSIFTAQVGVAGSTTLGSGVVAGGQAGIAGHVKVGDGARIAGQAGIIGDVAPGETLMGFPARPQREFLRGVASVYKVPDLLRKVRELEARLAALEGE
jgi:UDP-3-O-[3-hydroxymyristoyl] glucosamine N-acyltransferase